MERQILIRHENHDLTATIHYPTSESREGRVPLTVICHGFVGSRIGVDRLFVVTGRELAAEGQLVVRFDYAGCGESDGVYGEEGMESMIRQTRTVLDYAMTCADIDPSRVTLIGHSLGGAVALLAAVRDRRVKSLALWSSVGYPFNDIVKIVGRARYDESVRTGSSDYLGYSFTPGFFESLGAFQPFQEAGKFYGDVLVIHGTSDDVIPVDYAFLYQKLFWTREDSRCDKEIIFQADHTYSSGPHRRQLLDITKRWLQDRHKSEIDWQHWTI